MKNIIILCISISFLISDVNIKKKKDLLNKPFSGKIKNIMRYSKDSRIDIRVKKYGTVTIRIDNKYMTTKKEGNIIYVVCRERKFNQYIKCTAF